MKIDLLLHHAYGMGGSIRSVFNLSGELAKRHDVRIVSVMRREDEPFFPLPDGIPVRTLLDMREGAPQLAEGRAGERVQRMLESRSRVIPPQDGKRDSYNRVTDRLLKQYLRTTAADAVIATRPGLNMAVARYTRKGVIRGGQEHLSIETYDGVLLRKIRRRYRRLHVLSVLTEPDRIAFEKLFGRRGPRLAMIPNGIPPNPLPLSAHDAPLVLAVGRFIPIKQYPRLLDAFSKVAAELPDWQLRLFGSGPEKQRLRDDIERLGLYNNAFLMGRSTRIEEELPKGSILAVTSRFEGFPMGVVEAMSAGVPVVAFDVPYGLQVLIENGRNGVLVPPDDVDAFAAAVVDLARDPDRRRAMGKAARDTADAYAPATVATLWDDALAEVAAALGQVGGGGTRTSIDRPNPSV